MSKKGLLILIAAVAALGGLLFGYDTGVINGAQFYFSKYFELDAWMKGWVVGSALIGCLVGALSAGYITTKVGRKAALIMSALLFTVSALGSGLPAFMQQSVTLLVVFRIIGGLGIGLASMAAPTYIAEISPKDKRGILVTFYQLAVVTGFFVVFLATYYIGEGNTPQENIDTGWRWMFWSELIPCSIFLILTFFIPRSPRWLVLSGKEEEALKVLNTLHEKEEAQKEIDEIKFSLQKERKTQLKGASVLQKSVIPIIVIGSILSLLQQFTGINAVLYYGGDIFEKALGFTQEDVLAQQIMLGAVNFVFTFLAMFTVDKLGRKPLIYIGAVGMILGFALLGGSLYLDAVGLVSLIGILLFIGAFAMSMGPVTWVLLSEMFPNKIRSAAMSIAVAVQWAGNFLVSQSFPIIVESDANARGTGFWNGSLPYVIFIAFIIFLIFFTKKYIIETKGKSLEQLEGIWAEKYGEIES
ncbi:D-xylose transporter XylE [Marivirga tractuosa]|uniref:Sugar transporter n=1 Tax=Marivirga tractuosa (strain ATCC 23168 / DSM 4126 / NBRC 15989 / NCIMB 1408 / VKM B-1430 / H-43) TaxID=643867 RepID=E4TKJ0_MARTH|nr:sugar porter family MFS transporter [Marivirga tractuosa]ADR20170.1 sugar transporter [Marivirga tractuosa DSM 4126]BDD15389.1 D-xylose transporter XylE [Marivirga tractuosa]